MLFTRPAKALELLKRTAYAWVDHNAPGLGAAVAFYTIFAITPLFLIVLAVAGLWFGEEAASRQLFGQLHELVGPQGGEAIQAVVAAADRPGAGGWATALALVALFVGATGVFAQLQGALNVVWNIRRDSGANVRSFIKVRLLSFGMLLGVGFLLLVALVINAVLAAVGQLMSDLIPAQAILWQCVNFLISLGVVTLLFALIFKVMPDALIAWREVWIGALITGLMFNLGKYLLGLYLGRGSFASAYGAAGSLVIVLLWVYYSSQLVLFGAEFTRIYAEECGSRIQAKPGAHFVTVKEVEKKQAAARKT